MIVVSSRFLKKAGDLIPFNLLVGDNLQPLSLSYRSFLTTEGGEMVFSCSDERR